jgi:hypothetical protein
MEGQFIGPAAARTASFADEFTPDESDFAKLCVSH